VEYGRLPDGTACLTVIGRTILWWRSPDLKADIVRHLELQADSVVVLLSGQTQDANQPSGQRMLGQGLALDQIKAIYLEGDVLFAEDDRSIRCDQIYYDPQGHRALALRAVLRTFSPERGVPLYVRAGGLRQEAEDVFSGDDVVLTTSEFYVPQISFSAVHMRLRDSTNLDAATGELSRRSLVVDLNDVRLKYYDRTLLRLPDVRADLQGSDVPLRRFRMGYDGIWGPSLETRWGLSKVLGLREPKGTEGDLLLDYYGKRGPAAGVEVNYERETNFGRILGYGIYDTGEDALGRISERRDLEPPHPERGRFTVQHRQFLPRDWQLTGELSYLSDKNFLEQYYRSEFNVEKEQETLVHLKRIDGNQGFSLLAKGRVNDFADTVEQLPGAQFHWVGQSLLSDQLTFYSDSAAARFEYRKGKDSTATPAIPTGGFTFLSTRNEMDVPLRAGAAKVVPFAALTGGYDDGTGFDVDLDNSLATDRSRVWLGEAGVRATGTSLWKVYPDLQSRFWDLDQLRHVVTPQAMAASYWGSSVARQRDVLSLGLSQRLQTKRGQGIRQRTVNWLDWTLDFVWVDHAAGDVRSPNALIWSEPYVPLADPFSRRLPPLDRRTSTLFAAYRDYIGTTWICRMTDSTSILGDGYYDTWDQRMSQLNVGISHVRWPDLSYYIGSRYLRDFENGLGQKGSHAVTVAATYRVDPRYSVILSEQYDLEYKAGIRSGLSLVRQYHRLNYGVTLGVDQSLRQVSVVFGLWPQGVPELATGLTRYLEPGQ
jgi:hypothetical protein